MNYTALMVLSFCIPMHGMMMTPYKFIKKLDKHVAYLHSIYVQTKSSHDNDAQKTHSLRTYFTYDDVYAFEHDAVKSCIKKINYSKSIQPLFSLWNYIYRNQDEAMEHDYLLLREYSILVLFFYNKLFVSVQQHNKARVDGQKLTIDDLITIYASLKQMPLQKMMFTIDSILETFATILEEEQIGQSILNWLVRYWWMPPMIASAIIISMLRIPQTDTLSSTDT